MPLRQWMLRITAYAERLLDDLEPLDWSESIKEMQRNWIGRSEGAEVDFQRSTTRRASPSRATIIRVFTTRPDTLFGATYMVLAPEHPLVDAITTPEQRDGGRRPTSRRRPRKSDFDRTDLAKTKTGVFTGALRHQPGERRADPDLDRRLRAGGLRHRRDHGRARPRRARLRVRQAVRPADRPRRASRPTSG